MTETRPSKGPLRLVVRFTLAVGLLLAGCRSAPPGADLEPPSDRRVRATVERGIASWYGPGFHGKRTANGEVYDQNGVSAAHKTLPFGTVVEVLNLDNGRTLQVRINDRGPFVRGRIIDLSKGAARKLGVVRSGIANVEIRVVSRREPNRSRHGWTVQVGAFRGERSARSLARELGDLDAEVYSRDGWHRVQVRDLDTRKEADDTASAIRRRGHNAIVLEGAPPI